MIDSPMSLLRVYDLVTERLMVRLKTLHALLANGIMDFLVASKDDGGDEARKIEMRILQQSVFAPSGGVADEKPNPDDESTDFTG